MTFAQDSGGDDSTRELLRMFRAWGRAQADPSIRSRYRIIEHNLGRIFREPNNTALRSFLARNVAELGCLQTSSPHLFSRVPATRKLLRKSSGPESQATRREPRGALCRDWLSAIDELVAGYMPPHRRDDIKQGARLLMLEGAVSDPKSAVTKASKRYDQLHGTRRLRSFDAPVWGDSAITLHDKIAAPEYSEGEEDE